MSDLTIRRGDDPTLDLVLATASGAANLEGVDLWFTVKENTFDSDADAVIQKTTISGIHVVDEAGGIVEIYISRTDTDHLRARYLDVPLVWDVQLKDATEIVQTVAAGTLTIEADVTHST